MNYEENGGFQPFPTTPKSARVRMGDGLKSQF